jgi:MFS transporter, MHS family, proline/betaine transporter
MDQSVEKNGELSAIAKSSGRRALIAGVIGNALEWYDFAVYALFASIIARLYFPNGDATVSLLGALAAFGVGFTMRPLGAVVLGIYADRAGRKKALMTTMLLMGASTAAIGLAPTYDSIGGWATAVVVLGRLMQGFSAGGEFGSSTAFIIEHATERRRGFTASLQQSSQAAALLVGSLTGAAVTGLLSTEDLLKWGWRVPFLLGLAILPAGLYIRSQVNETPLFAKCARSVERAPLSELIHAHGSQVSIGLGLVIVWTVCSYFFLVYMPTYSVHVLGLPQSGSLIANSLALVVLMVLSPLFGGLSDTFGRKPFLLGGGGAICILTLPLFTILTNYPSLPILIMVQVVMAAAIAVFAGPAPAALGELYPVGVRSTGLSLAYNGAVTAFGGFAPFISTWLVAKTGNSLAPTWYAVSASALSIVALIFMRETAHTEMK